MRYGTSPLRRRQTGVALSLAELLAALARATEEGRGKRWHYHLFGKQFRHAWSPSNFGVGGLAGKSSCGAGGKCCTCATGCGGAGGCGLGVGGVSETAAFEEAVSSCPEGGLIRNCATSCRARAGV